MSTSVEQAPLTLGALLGLPHDKLQPHLPGCFHCMTTVASGEPFVLIDIEGGAEFAHQRCANGSVQLPPPTKQDAAVLLGIDITKIEHFERTSASRRRKK